MARPGAERRFIGRQEELVRLDSILASASEGDARFVVVSGPAGVGKSSLLAEFATRAGARVLIGSCLPLGEQGVPFASIVEVLRAVVLDPSMNQSLPPGLGSLVPALASNDAPTQPTSRTQLFQTMLEVFEQLAESATTVLIIEDLHWADRSTRDLLTFLVSNLRAHRILVVLSYRTEDVHRDHPLRPVLVELVRNPRLDRVELAPFDVDLVAEQITDLTGVAPSRSVLSTVMERTQGNPYFVQELVVADCLDSGSLPASLRELLLVRAQIVSAEVRRTLRILSLTEEHIGDETLAAVAGVPVGEIRDHIREAIDMRLLVSSRTGTRVRPRTPPRGPTGRSPPW